MNTLRAIARLQKKEIFMPDIYQTSDGKQFHEGDNAMAKYQAEDHQRFLDGQSSSSSLSASAPTRDDNAVRYSTCINLYNAGNWNELSNQIKVFNNQYAGCINTLIAIAMAHKGNYTEAFEAIDFDWVHSNRKEDTSIVKNFNILRPQAIELAKKAFERANGRTMAKADLTKLQLADFEKNIVSEINGYKTGKRDGRWIAEYKNRWEATAGKKMTKEDEIRIAGEPFPKVTGSSSSSTSSTSGGSILFNIIGAIVVAIIGFNILGWLGLIGGAVGGFFIGKWLGAKLIGKILLIALLVIVGGTFIISKLPSKPATETTETTATEEGK
jgi:hypothetical protein